MNKPNFISPFALHQLYNTYIKNPIIINVNQVNLCSNDFILTYLHNYNKNYMLMVIIYIYMRIKM